MSILAREFLNAFAQTAIRFATAADTCVGATNCIAEFRHSLGARLLAIDGIVIGRCSGADQSCHFRSDPQRLCQSNAAAAASNGVVVGSPELGRRPRNPHSRCAMWRVGSLVLRCRRSIAVGQYLRPARRARSAAMVVAIGPQLFSQPWRQRLRLRGMHAVLPMR